MKPHPTLATKPAELQGVLYDFWWDLEKLHKLELPTSTLPIKDLLWHLDLPYWKHDDKPFQITPRQVMDNPEKYRHHFKRTCDADLHYPMIVRQVEGRVLIVDGVHRLLRAVLEHRQQVECALFSDDQIPLILHSD